MDFPVAELLDQAAWYDRLVAALHPDGLTCPRCGSARHGVHRPHREPVLDYRCRDCRAVFNAYTGTVLRGTSRRPSTLVLILRGVAQGVSTARLARELGCNRMKLLALRHKLQDHARAGLAADPLPDAVVEADECYVNAGEKKASRIASRMTRRGAGLTSGAGMGRSTTTGRRWPRRSAVRPGGPPSMSSSTPTG